MFVFGPYIRYRLGKPGTVIPRCADGLSGQSDCPRAVIRIGSMKSVVLKPVA